MRYLSILAGSLILAGGAALFLTGSASPGRGTPPLVAAKAAFADGNYAEAERILRTLSGPDARLFLGRVLVTRGRLTEARGIFETLMKEEPGNVGAVRGMAELYEGLGQPELALAYRRRAVDLDKENSDLWKELALAQERSGDSSGALASIQEALHLDPSRSDLSALASRIATSDPLMAGTTRTTAPEAPAARRGQVLTPRVPDPHDWFPKPGGQKQ